MAQPYFTWPITLTAATDDLIVTIGGSKETLALGTTTTARWSSTDFTAAIKTALETHTNSATWTLSVSDSGVLTMTHSAVGAVTMHWDEMTASTVQLLGFDDSAADTAGDGGTAASFTSDYIVGNSWFPDVPCAGDDHERPNWLYSHFEGVAVPGVTQVYGSWMLRTWSFGFVAAVRISQHFADQAAFATASGITVADPNIAFENMFEQLVANTAIYYHTGPTDTGSGPYYILGNVADMDAIAKLVAVGGGAWHDVKFTLKG